MFTPYVVEVAGEGLEEVEGASTFEAEWEGEGKVVLVAEEEATTGVEVGVEEGLETAEVEVVLELPVVAGKVAFGVVVVIVVFLRLQNL